MKAGLLPVLAGAMAVVLLGSLAAAQNPPPASPPAEQSAMPPSSPPAEQSATPPSSPPPEQSAMPPSSPSADQAAAAFTPQQLDQLTAPIALYPDPLLSQILMAATYPLEVVEAKRWLLQSDNAALKGDQLAAALAQQRWDPSVKSLVAFPQILHMMDANLTWTEQLGDAFLASQTALMDSVQRLRHKAAAAGKLQSTPQQVVSDEGGVIIVEPPDQNIVYVPVYNPNTVYGPWPYPDYPPDYFPDAFPDVANGDLSFGWLGLGIVPGLWGWAICDWHHHRLDIDPKRFTAPNPRQPGIASGFWQHDPLHRGGVPYRDPAVRARYQGAATPAAIRAARGYPVAAPPAPVPLAVNTHPAAEAAPTMVRPAPPTLVRPAPPTVLRPAPPVMRSLGSGPEVRAQSARGQASRMSLPAPRAVVAPPAPRFVPPAPRAVAPAAVGHGGGEHR